MNCFYDMSKTKVIFAVLFFLANLVPSILGFSNLNGVASAEPENSVWISSDLDDYPPGGLVTLIGGGWTGDSEVRITVEDDSKDWMLEKIVQVAKDGSIEFQFNLPDKYLPKYSVTAEGVTTGRTADTAFTDSAGSYTLKYGAYDPNYYNFKLPSNYPVLPSNRANDPMPGANGTYPILRSLQPTNLALGQIVPFEMEITVNGSTDPEGGVINYTCLWDTYTTSGIAFGFDPNYMVLAAFVDYGDPRNIDTGVPASATIVSSAMSGTNIQGNFQVSGLQNGDKVIVEMWVVLKSQLPTGGSSGNVQTSVLNAKTATGSVISTGNQTVPLNRTGEFTSATADVSITKSDAPDPLYAGDTLNYTIRTINNSTTTVANGIEVTDTLDPNVTFVSATGGGTLSGGTITWPAFALEPGAQMQFTVTVTVKNDAPTSIYGGASPHSGLASGTRLNNADVSNVVNISKTVSTDPNLANNVWQEPTNVLPRVSVTGYKVWIGGPASDHQPVTMTLYRQVGSGPKEPVTGVTPAVTPTTGPAGTFTYNWTGLPMYSPSFQPYTYTADESTVPTNYTKTVGANNTVTNTYRPSLTISKVYGTTPLQGAVFELYSGTSSGPTGGALASATTGPDGKATFEHLADGTYWLVEATPPPGYNSNSNIGPFTVANGTITGPVNYLTVPDGTTGNYGVTVQDLPIAKLPNTGGTGTLPFMAIGFALMAIGAVVYFRKSR